MVFNLCLLWMKKNVNYPPEGESNQDYMEQLFIRNWIESKGYDAIVYDNEFEGGGQSLIILRPEQIKIVNKEQLKIQPEEEQSKKLNLQSKYK